MQNEKPIRMLFVRHGESDGNVNDGAYLSDGDQGVGLTDTGWIQTYHSGDFLGDLYERTGTKEWPALYLSYHLRTQQSCRSVIKGIGDKLPGLPKLYGDPRLIEKFFGATNHIHNPDKIKGLDPEFAENMRILSNAVYEKDPYTTRNLFGDSSRDITTYVDQFIATLRRDMKEGKRDFLSITHGAVIQAILSRYARLPPDRAKQAIGNPNNGDVISIEGFPGNWEFKKIYDGPRGQATDINLLENVRPYNVDDLPEMPDHIKQKLDL